MLLRALQNGHGGRLCFFAANCDRTKPYGEDLRWNVKFAIVADGDSVDDVARQSGVCSTTVGNWWTQFRDTEEVAAIAKYHLRRTG